MNYKKAVKVAIRKHKHMLDNYLDEVIDNWNSDEDAASDDDDDDADEDETISPSINLDSLHSMKNGIF
jgi:hypothetical protein